MDINVEGGSSLSVNDDVFSADYNEALVHQAVVAYMNGARSGTKAQKNRSDVSGGGKKPWRQKGTGRARSGTIRSPIWRAGGVTFAARNRDFSQKMNKKMYRAAMRSALSELVREERLKVVDSVGIDGPKTKAMRAYLNDMGIDKVLLVEASNDTYELSDAAKAIRNLPHCACVGSQQVSPLDLVAYEFVLFTADALKQVEERLA